MIFQVYVCTFLISGIKYIKNWKVYKLNYTYSKDEISTIIFEVKKSKIWLKSKNLHPWVSDSSVVQIGFISIFFIKSYFRYKIQCILSIPWANLLILKKSMYAWTYIFLLEVYEIKGSFDAYLLLEWILHILLGGLGSWKSISFTLV